MFNGTPASGFNAKDISNKKSDLGFKNIKCKQERLYEITFSSDFDFDAAVNYFSGGKAPNRLGACTVARKEGLIGRNLDWLYDDDSIFVAHTLKTDDRYASLATITCLGLTDKFVKSGEYSEKYKVLPYFTMDGVNENGIWCTTLVVPADFGHTNQNTGKTKACTVMLPRILLDSAQTLEEAETILNSYDWFTTTEEENHFLFGDSETTKLLEFINGETIITTPDPAVLTNFHLHNVEFDDNGEVDLNTVEDHGQGIKRYNLMTQALGSVSTSDDMLLALKNLNYTQTYSKDFEDDDFWLTEYCSNTEEYGNLTVTTPKADFEPLVLAKQEIYNQHQRNGSYWQTVENCVYDMANRTLTLCVDENNTKYIFTFDGEIQFDDNDYVHKTGDEVIQGTKQFAGAIKGVLKDTCVVYKVDSKDTVAVQIDCESYSMFSIAPPMDSTLITLSAEEGKGYIITVKINNENNYTCSFTNSITWLDGNTPSFDGTNIFTFFSFDGSTWYGKKE